MAESTPNTKNKDTGKSPVFDTRIVIKGAKGEEVRKKLEEKMDKETRPTYGNAIADILLIYFGLKEKPQGNG